MKALTEQVKGKRVFVGLSGGVDSAVSAALLQQAGADIVGVFIKGWYPPGIPCTWADDRRDAMRVAAHLSIPFHTLDASIEYKKGVIDYLLSEYAAGRTPNPDIMCNREVKFGAFYDFAREHGAEYIATGHYARAQHMIDAPDGGHARLLRGIDTSKDQSYFLWAVPQEALDHTIFPIGDLEKTEVRKLAQRFILPVAEKRDSQGICFLGSISVDDFLRSELHPEEGLAIDDTGKEIGKHDGAVLHTLGQRIALRDAEAGPWYVIKKDVLANTLTVSREPATGASRQTITLEDSNWFDPATEITSTLGAQYRYHGPITEGTLNADRTIFTAANPLLDPIASGQSLVLYSDEQCIGGGIIA